MEILYKGYRKTAAIVRYDEIRLNNIFVKNNRLKLTEILQ